MIDYRIMTLNSYRQRIIDLIHQGNPERTPEDAAFWMKKLCEMGCDVKLERDTSVRILEDLVDSISLQLKELRSLYADSSFYV